jgi:hypothetical protein
MDSFRELLGHICLRPQLFVGVRNFALVAAYLDGYDHGCARRGESAEAELRQLGAWLSRRFGLPGMFNWSRNLLRHCDEDPELAFKRLVPLYDEFVAERGEKREV